MPRGTVQWTDEVYETIRKRRADGVSYDDIARMLGVCRSTLCYHWDRARRHEPPPPPKRRMNGVQDRITLCRPPLPAGAPESWNLLTAGTCLEGEPYPVELVRADALRLMRSAR